jgi:hypothetical protein
LIVSSGGAQVDLNESKVSAVFLCVDESQMMLPFKRGKVYYAEFLENYFPHCPNKRARDAWFLDSEDLVFPLVVTIEEIDNFFRRFA